MVDSEVEVGIRNGSSSSSSVSVEMDCISTTIKDGFGLVDVFTTFLNGENKKWARFLENGGNDDESKIGHAANKLKRLCRIMTRNIEKLERNLDESIRKNHPNVKCQNISINATLNGSQNLSDCDTELEEDTNDESHYVLGSTESLVKSASKEMKEEEEEGEEDQEDEITSSFTNPQKTPPLQRTSSKKNEGNSKEIQDPSLSPIKTPKEEKDEKDYERIKRQVLDSSSDDDLKEIETKKKLDYEKIKRKMLESSDDDDNVIQNTNNGNVQNISPESSPDKSSSDEEIEKLESNKKKTSKDSSNAAAKLKMRFQQLVDNIDLENDKKIKLNNRVIVDKLPPKIESALHKNCATINVVNNSKDILNYFNIMKAKPLKNNFNKDKEVTRLCNLGALKNMRKNIKEIVDSSDDDDHYCRDKKAKMSNSNRKKVKIKLADMSSNDESQGEEDHSSDDGKQKNNFAYDHKPMVISSSDDNDIDNDSDSDLDLHLDDKDPKKKKKNDLKKSKMSGTSKDHKTLNSRPNFMNVKLDETDSDEALDKAAKKRIKKDIMKKSEKSSKSDDTDSDFELTKPKKANLKKRMSNQIDSDDSSGVEILGIADKNSESDDNSDSDEQLKKRKRGKKKSDSSFEDSDEEPRPKKKRKRIKRNSSSDEKCSDNNSNDEETESPSKGRKNIRKMLKEKKLTKETKEATEIERDRRKRMEEKQVLYNKEFNIKKDGEMKEIVLDFDPETKETLCEVDTRLVKKLKKHQGEGIKFMWDSVFESKNDVENGVSPGGAILAHCMGLGKTLQTIGLIHTVMTNFPEQISSVLVLCPVNTVKNWDEEFSKWLKGDMELDVYEMSKEKDVYSRADRLKLWQREGGVQIMGYDMFRNLTNENNKKFKKSLKGIFKETLLDPGPDMVVCDEGHVLKNNKSALNACMTKIKTKRRIILTGTPLQNNLSEYYAMVNFVKPNLLGTFNEFKNRFVNPIQNGQHSDSTERDVRIMKKRSFILNDLLKGCLQRLDYNVLVPYLQPKHEYVLCINLSRFQKKLYKYYLENFARAGQIGSEGKLEGGKKGGLFYDVQNLSRIWNHPYILLMAKEKADVKKMFEDDESDMNHFVVNDDDESEAKATSDEDDDMEILEENIVSKKRNTRGNNDGDLVDGLDSAKAEELANDKGWWNQFLEENDDLENLEFGSKMVLLMDILKECELLGDKVLVFSQSLMSLDMIEIFLEKVDYANTSIRDNDAPSYLGSWKKRKDYFRLDGSTPPEDRKITCNAFNKKENHRMRLFLISTKAGGLGINLVAANRVIIFDASWNPAHDVQSIFRVYRFGQQKPVYIYRFLARGTMEEKIYDRQVTKQSLSARVVDEQQIERHFSMNELAELYEFKDDEEQPIPKVPEDLLLAEMIKKHADKIWKYHDHDSLLENQVDENLTEEERKLAWEEFEKEKKGHLAPNLNQGNLSYEDVSALNRINPQQIQDAFKRYNPGLTHDQIVNATRNYIQQWQNAITGKVVQHQHQQQQQLQQQQQQLQLQQLQLQQQQKKQQQLLQMAQARRQYPQHQYAMPSSTISYVQQQQQTLQRQMMEQQRLQMQRKFNKTQKPRSQGVEEITLDDDEIQQISEIGPTTSTAANRGQQQQQDSDPLEISKNHLSSNKK